MAKRERFKQSREERQRRIFSEEFKMCEFAYENGKAERLNGIIKNNYLKFYEANTLGQLHKNVDRAVTLYNTRRPHKSLHYQTLVDFENKVVLLHEQTTPKMTGSLDAIIRE